MTERNLHAITITPTTDGTCGYDEDAPCRESNGECELVDTFNNGYAEYVGEDATEGGPPDISRSDPVHLSRPDDYTAEWHWDEVDR